MQRWRTIHVFLILRLIVAALVVGAGIMIIQVTNERFPVRPLYVLLGSSAITGAAVYALLRAGISFRAGVWTITVADIALESALIHYSGGVGSHFSMIYCLTIVAAAFLLEMPGGLASAAMASALFAGYGALETLGAIHPGAADGLAMSVRRVGVLNSYMHVSIFFLVGSVGGYLAHRINLNRQELEHAETRLEQLRIDTDFIVNNMSSGVLVVDSDGLVVTLNPAAEKILGITVGDVRMNHVDAALGERAPGMADELSEALRSEEGKLRHEITLERADGTHTPLGVSVSLLRDAEGLKRGAIVVFQDLTEVHEMRERVRKADRLAAIGALSAGIAHEIRNPLASISGSIELLQNELELDGENGRLMELIMRESDRLDRIITDFLNFAKLRRPRKRPVNVETCLDEVLTLVRNNAAITGGVDIELSAAECLPAVRADDEQLRQVFFNLAINSCEAMNDGGRLAIAVDGDDEGVSVSFRDEGPGIVTDDVGRLFEPFYTTKEDGTGLGLAIANKIVAAHGGRIEFTNRESGGAEFVIMLPVGRVEPVTAPRAINAKSNENAVPAGACS